MDIKKIFGNIKELFAGPKVSGPATITMRRNVMTYRDLLKKIKDMPNEKLDDPIYVSDEETMCFVSDMITTTVEIDKCNPGDSYLLLES